MSTAATQEGIPQPVIEQMAGDPQMGQQQKGEGEQGQQRGQQWQAGPGWRGEAAVHLAISLAHGIALLSIIGCHCVTGEPLHGGRTHGCVVAAGRHGRGDDIGPVPADTEGQIADKHQRQQKPGQ